MKRKLSVTLFFLMAFLQWSFSQEKEISGKVTSSQDNGTLPGVTVLVKGTTTGTITSIDGTYKLKVPADAKTLVFSTIGMATKEVEIGSSTTIDVVMSPEAKELTGVVVTAMGISREKKSLGYATQEISGDKLSTVKSGNVINQISGKVSGVQVKNSGNMGGSTNIIIRGTSSILGNNQALFIVDGVPINNTVTNDATTKANPASVTGGQSNGASGYDYGNPISDLNPEDIESVNVLKGAAATALYGSRAANGVILITTKKGKMAGSGRKRFGATFNTNFNMGVVDKSTFTKYQNEYGAGYGPYYSGPGGFWFVEDVTGDGVDDQVVPYTEDASFGAKFDGSNVYQWTSWVPGHANYHKATPWVGAGDNNPVSFFEKSLNVVNSLALDGGTDKGAFRLSYSNQYQKGIMPNSSLKKNTLGFNGSMAFTDKFSATISANYVRNEAIGRNATGYVGNEVGGFRQWWQTNVSIKDMKEVYDMTKLNIGWNPASATDPGTPIFWDNLYFKRYENYTQDQRDRFFGNVSLNYQITKGIGFMTRFTVDQYTTIQEERMAKGSTPANFGIGRPTIGSGYSRYNINYREMNADFMLNLKKDISEDFNITGLLGSNFRRSNNNTIFASTNGGIEVDRLYSLSNSKQTPLPAQETDVWIGVNGFFASASLGYKRFLFLDVTARQDYSSTLPAKKNHFFYPGVSGSFVFSEKLKHLSWLDFGKLRLNYAYVGNDAPPQSITPVYDKPATFNSIALFSVRSTRNNPDLKPEISTTQEAGLEMVFFKKRLGFDFAVYKKTTVNQIVPVATTPSTGYSFMFKNAGTLQNKGIELNVYGTPIQTDKFKWTVNVNYSRNRNKVIELYEGVQNLQVASFQGGITLNATVGQPYGTLKGYDFVYKDGEKVIDASGHYKKSPTADIVIGNINPDFNLGVTNSFSYQNWTASFLIDMQKGGSVYSLDMYYGSATGIYPESVGNNDLGYPKRNDLADNGGIVLEGVTETGEKNTVRIPVEYGTLGYVNNPDKAFIYDASYVKLREASISYRFSFKKEMFFSNASLGLVGSNLWIIYKNLPYADPETGLGAGNVQGYQSGVLPTTRNFGFNLTLQF